jgi:hypothetical protein
MELVFSMRKSAQRPLKYANLQKILENCGLMMEGRVGDPGGTVSKPGT